MTKQIETANKLLALANKGVGGERINAIHMLNKHIAKYGLNKTDFLTDEEKIKFRNSKEEKEKRDRELRMRIRKEAYDKFYAEEMRKFKMAEQLAAAAKALREQRIKTIKNAIWNIILCIAICWAFFIECSK